jgi:hypothetical protein
MIWLIRLYPKAWRERYGDEFSEVLLGQHASVGMIVDVLGGALDAHLHPQVHVRQTETAKGDAMTADMMKRCALGGPKVSKKEMVRGSLVLAVVYIALTFAYVRLTKAFHGSPAVEALGYSLFAVMTLVYLQMGYLRRRSAAAQALFVGGFSVFIYLAMWAICATAAAIEPVGRHLR